MKGYKERDGKIYVRVTRRDKEGRRREFWTKVNSKSEVKRARRELENELDAPGGVDALTNKDTLDEWLDKWLTIVKPTVKARTFEDYKNVARLYIRPTLGTKRLKDIEGSDIEVWVAGLQSNVSTKTESNLSARTIRYAYTVLGMALRRAKRKRLLTVNPCEDVENLPARKRREMTALSAEQTVAFLEQAKGINQYLVFKFAIYTGMRPEEYLALQWKNVNLREGTVTVQRVISWPHWETRGAWKFETPKTERSRRTLDLSGDLLADLRVHKKHQGEHRLKLGNKYQNFDLVFASEVGTPIGLRNLSRAFKPILQAANLPDIRLYDLRHSFATLLLGAGENIKVISMLLGHSDETETMRTYLHVTPAMKRGSADTLERILKKG